LPVIVGHETIPDILPLQDHRQLDGLPQRARVGTSSLRRRCQLQARRNDLSILDIRGNVGTRLQKLDAGEYDALVLATAGVKRLGLEHRIREYIEPGVMLPAIGQGAMGIETRADDHAVLAAITPLNHEPTHSCVIAERSLSRRLFGGCHVPVAAHAGIADGEISMSALVGRTDGSEILRASIKGPQDDAEALGDQLGHRLLDMGAGRILRELMDESDV